MDDLIKRLKAATEGNAELSAEIARDVVGLKFHEWPNWVVTTSRMHDFPALVWCPAYTESLDAAVTLIPAGIFWGAGSTATNYAWAGVRQFAGAATPALALCIAALMAREAG